MLNHSVSIIVPSTKFAEPIPDEDYQHRIDETLKAMSKYFGGATALAGQGAYISQDTGELIKEKVAVVTSYTDELSGIHLNDVRAIVESLGQFWQQETVAYTIDGVMQFV